MPSLLSKLSSKPSSMPVESTVKPAVITKPSMPVSINVKSPEQPSETMPMEQLKTMEPVARSKITMSMDSAVIKSDISTPSTLLKQSIELQTSTESAAMRKSEIKSEDKSTAMPVSVKMAATKSKISAPWKQSMDDGASDIIEGGRE